MKKQFNLWSIRNLSLIGKILISKSHGISNLIFSMTMGEMKNEHSKNAQDAINKFIWGYKPPKVKHTTLIGPFEKGGLKTIDIETMNMSIRLAWLARLIDDRFQKIWSTFISIKAQL